MLSEDDKWYAVSLRLCGDSLDPTNVEALIGLSPTRPREGVERCDRGRDWSDWPSVRALLREIRT
jgi:hypothetical protein